MKRFAILLLFLFATAAPAFSQCSPFMGIGAAQFLDQTGTPLTNGALYVYTAGTSTQAPSYQDSQCSVLNTNPVTFTTGGRATIWINTGSFFKYVLCSSSTDGPFCAAGDTLFSVDNVPGGASSSGGGGGAPFISNTPSPATSGVLRLASGDSICWRNAAGSANLCFSKDSNDVSTLVGAVKIPEVGAPAGASQAVSYTRTLETRVSPRCRRKRSKRSQSLTTRCLPNTPCQSWKPARMPRKIK